MILTPRELAEIYEAVIKPFGHPDPSGFLTRVLMTSEGDPDYIDVNGKVGFMPVSPGVAAEMVGSQEVQSLQGNLIATLSMDRINFDNYNSLDDMIIAFHYGDENLENKTPDQLKFLRDVHDSREDALAIIYPPNATVSDVIKLLKVSNSTTKLNKSQSDFFNQLLSGV